MTMTKADLIALAERVERAEGPNYALDCEVAVAVWWAKWGKRRPKDIRVPAYTASIDAAMTLVPPPGKWSMTAGHANDWQTAIWLEDGRELDWRSATTPSLALTSASLRAIAEEMD